MRNMLTQTRNNHFSERLFYADSLPQVAHACYDANGNLVYDLDRGISVIRYNILNLPYTIQFINGNQIVNHYDAVGRKYRSITYTVDATTFTPHYSIEHYTFDTDTVQHIVMEHGRTL